MSNYDGESTSKIGQHFTLGHYIIYDPWGCNRHSCDEYKHAQTQFLALHLFRVEALMRRGSTEIHLASFCASLSLNWDMDRGKTQIPQPGRGGGIVPALHSPAKLARLELTIISCINNIDLSSNQSVMIKVFNLAALMRLLRN